MRHHVGYLRAGSTAAAGDPTPPILLLELGAAGDELAGVGDRADELAFLLDAVAVRASGEAVAMREDLLGDMGGSSCPPATRSSSKQSSSSSSSF